MITTDNLPQGFKPYQNLVFCSNAIQGGGHIFALGNVLPLLIGVGPSPRIWLQAIAAPGSKAFVTIVSDSNASHSAARVTKIGKKVIVSVMGKTVLAVEAKDENSAEVSVVDFRPLGLDVFGSSASLNLGGMQLSNNTFSGVNVAFGLGA